MEATVFNPAQQHILELLSFVKTQDQLDELKSILASYFAQKVDEEMDMLSKVRAGFNKMVVLSVKLVSNNKDTVTKVYLPKFVLLNILIVFYIIIVKNQKILI